MEDADIKRQFHRSYIKPTADDKEDGDLRRTVAEAFQCLGLYRCRHPLRV